MPESPAATILKICDEAILKRVRSDLSSAGHIVHEHPATAALYPLPSLLIAQNCCSETLAALRKSSAQIRSLPTIMLSDPEVGASATKIDADFVLPCSIPRVALLAAIRALLKPRLGTRAATRHDTMREFLHDATGERFRLCNSHSDLPREVPQVGERLALTSGALSRLRELVLVAASRAHFSGERARDIMTAASEAAMNAVVHARGGTAVVRADGAQKVQVWIKDKGEGIPLSILPQATLTAGYTTSATLGRGMTLMLDTADRTWMLTGNTGTTVVLELLR